MKFLVLLLLGLPAAIVTIALAVANRHSVMFSLDPTTTVDANPALSFAIPLWILTFGLFFLGLIIGGIASWASQHRYRSEARRKRREANHWHSKADEEHERVEAMREERAESRREHANDDAPQIRRRPLPALTAPGR